MPEAEWDDRRPPGDDLSRRVRTPTLSGMVNRFRSGHKIEAVDDSANDGASKAFWWNAEAGDARSSMETDVDRSFSVNSQSSCADLLPPSEAYFHATPSDLPDVGSMDDEEIEMTVMRLRKRYVVGFAHGPRTAR